MDSVTFARRWKKIVGRLSSNVGHRVTNLKPDLHRSKASLSSSSATGSDDSDTNSSIPSPAIPTSEQSLPKIGIEDDTDPNSETIEAAMSEYLATHAFPLSSPDDPNTVIGPKDAIDTLISTDYTRLKDQNQVYLDYMGGCLLPESLVTSHADFLKSHILGNTHSDSPRCVYFFFYVVVLVENTARFVPISDPIKGHLFPDL